jgi:hypothetical protein
VTPALDHLTAALYFVDCAEHSHNAAERAWFSQVALSYRRLAIEDGRRYARELQKRPTAASVKRRFRRESGSASLGARRKPRPLSSGRGS